jgi:hypothetical protein
MKKLQCLLVTAFLLAFASTSFAASALVSVNSGALIQHGTKATWTKEVGLDIPTLTKAEKGYQLVTEITYQYADRPYFDDVLKVDTIQEMNVVKTFSTHYKEFLFKDVVVGFGAGTWLLLNSNGGDKLIPAFKFELGYSNYGIRISLGSEYTPVDGYDMYLPYAKVMLLSL